MATQMNIEFENVVHQLENWLARDQESATPRFRERTSYAVSPSKVLGTLLRHQVRFILFGGLAAMFHGWPGPTSDVDVMPDLRKDNRLALWRAAQDLIGRRLEELGAGGVPANPPEPLDVRDFGLGVLFNPFYPEVGGYFELLRDSVPCTIGSGTFRVASLEGVIKSMTLAARPKDQEKLPELTCLLQMTRAAGD
ncbi:hypothetical protein GCM10010302_10700 [Streptomyces polychromogenes]|uniref:Polymerase nucleotidyl transferase domain-containing protein n=2 Tax=Streptomyces TaxID=1883 RepID=A0ABP3ERQ5_9ACTN